MANRTVAAAQYSKVEEVSETAQEPKLLLVHLWLKSVEKASAEEPHPQTANNEQAGEAGAEVAVVEVSLERAE